jgi:hypothetical protein
VERALRDNELPRRVEAGNEVSVDVVATLVVVAGLELDPGVVVGQDIGETVFRPIAWQIGSTARFLSANMFQFFILFGESEIGIGGHDSVMFGEIFELDRFRGFDDGVGEGDVVAVTHVAGCATFQTRQTGISVTHPGKRNVTLCLQR